MKLTKKEYTLICIDIAALYSYVEDFNGFPKDTAIRIDNMITSEKFKDIDEACNISAKDVVEYVLTKYGF